MGLYPILGWQFEDDNHGNEIIYENDCTHTHSREYVSKINVCRLRNKIEYWELRTKYTEYAKENGWINKRSLYADSNIYYDYIIILCIQRKSICSLCFIV